MPEDPEHKRARKKAWDEANAEHKKAYWKKWYAENKDELNARKREKSKTPEARAYHAKKNREWKRANPERAAGIAKRERQKNAERYREYGKRYYEKTAEQQKAAVRAWVVANRDRRNAYTREWSRQWRAANPELARAVNHRRRAAEADPEYTAILAFDPCSYCGGLAGTIDHIIPVSDDGPGDFSNLTAACLSCNSGKCNTSLLHFLLR